MAKPGKKTGESPAEQFTQPGQEEPSTASKAAKTPRPKTTTRSRRSREPRLKVVITSRLEPLTDARLSLGCEDTGNGPQDIIETALNAFLDRINVPNDPEQDERLNEALEVSLKRARPTSA